MDKLVDYTPSSSVLVDKIVSKPVESLRWGRCFTLANAQRILLPASVPVLVGLLLWGMVSLGSLTSFSFLEKDQDILQKFIRSTKHLKDKKITSMSLRHRMAITVARTSCRHAIVAVPLPEPV